MSALYPLEDGEWRVPPDPRTTIDVEWTEPETWVLLDHRGDVLRTFSDRPPTGFHQGTKEPPR